MDEKALRISNPCSDIERLIIALMVVKVRLTDSTFRPLSIRISRTLPASVVLYSERTLFPQISITTPAFLNAA